MNHINKEILSLSLPAIVTNITTPLLSLVDLAIVGHMGAASYIGAIAIGGSMFNMLYWLFGFLRMGSSGMTAQAYGANDSLSQSRVLRQALLVATIAGITMIMLQKPICDLTLRFMEADSTTGFYASTYFFILIWGAPAVLANYAVCGWLLGMQNSRATMWISLLINISNIALSCTLVYIFNLGIIGVAVGTLVAQWLGLIYGIIIIAKNYNLVSCPIKLLLDGQKLKHFFSINADIFLRTLCIVTITMWFTRTGASQGAEMLAVNALLMQFFTLFSFFMDGFGFAGEAMAGKYIGAKDYCNLRKSVNWLCIWGGAIALLFTLIYAFGGTLILQLLSNDTNVTVTAKEYLAWVISVPAIGFLAFTWDGIFIGATATRAMLLSILLASIAFFTVYFSTYHILQNHGLWLAFVCYLFTRAAVLTLIGRRYRK